MNGWIGRVVSLLGLQDPTASTGANPYAGRSSQGRLVYAVGDIHGMAHLLPPFFDAVAFDLSRRPENSPVDVVFVGDYIDCGPRSRTVLDVMVALKKYPAWKTHFLKGDHEEIFLRFLERPADGWHWLENGGRATLTSYGIGVGEGALDLTGLRDEVLRVVPLEHLDFVRGLERYWRAGDYAFVHAGYRPGRPLAEQEDEDLFWMLPETMDWMHGAMPGVVVHGHTPGGEVHLAAHRICIDTGAHLHGRLSAVSILDDKVTRYTIDETGVSVVSCS